MITRRTQIHKTKCRGMTLIEVLVAAVIIGVGLLGVASLQITALQGASNADYRSRATDLTASLADRMRANLFGVDANDYITDVAADCTNPPDEICAMTPDDTSTNGIADCSAAEMATFDLWEISCRNGVQTSLPGGEMIVSCIDNDATDADPCSPVSTMVVTITWQVQSDTAAPQTETVVTSIVPGAPREE
ncbi:MAG: type IV pilus modification protein PilV [Candidatus Thiodiazotropha taylori]|nr:type IV pilus modification protein PilV [Candidatus Thiodiazotropha taylori]MCG7972719.1 type IV pilus modification protein PilV [Candidatus Thiodiazotropha taylori]MCG7995388.1 type IV pilus modification protein PilV [Candidatus Thiodiazotropha taylori]